MPIWLFISEPVFIELLIVLRSSQYILKWWNKTGFFHNEIHVHVYLYFLRMPCLSQKIYINCLKKLCRHHPILNQNSLSWLSFVLQANKNQCLSLTNLLQKKIKFTLLPKCTRKKSLRVLWTRMVFHSLNKIRFKINKDLVFKTCTTSITIEIKRNYLNQTFSLFIKLLWIKAWPEHLFYILYFVFITRQSSNF